MTTTSSHQTIALLLLLLLPGVSHAQAPAEAPEPEPTAPVYEIELIIFEYVNGVNGKREDWTYIDTGRAEARLEQQALAEARRLAEQRLIDPDTLPLADEPDQDEQPAMPEVDPEGEDSDDAPDLYALEYTPVVDDTAYRLAEQVSRMRNSRDYRPLLHVAWRQPVYDDIHETTLALDRLADLPATLGASASLYVNRFLHLTLDLELAERAPLATAPDIQTTIYRLNERRKMRSAELHFFDHPRFGALALISRTDEVKSLAEPAQ